MVATLSLRLNDRRNWLTNRVTRSSPTWGSFVFTTATRAAKTGVNGKLADCAFITLRQNNPRPRTRFSSNSSGTMSLMFVTFTLLTIPVMLFRSASQLSRWYSLDVLSAAAASRSARSRAGGMYTPPERVLVSFTSSARASAARRASTVAGSSSFCSFSSSAAAVRAASWRSRSALRTGSTSDTRGSSTPGEADRRRKEGGAVSPGGECERELLGVSLPR
jgi:hypothetical protein